MSSDFTLLLATAFVMGIGSSGHCFSMCGGIACALGLKQESHSILPVVLYNTGRILAYTSIAFLLGKLVQQAIELAPWLATGLRTGAALLLVMMALHTLQWWRGILILEQLGQHLWHPLQTAGKKLLPGSGSSMRPLVMGFIWGWLPCALVYSTLVWAITQAGNAHAGFLMLAFGLGTTPVMLVSGISAIKIKTLMQSTAWRYGMASLLIACAAWTTLSAWQHHHHAQKMQDHSHNTDIHAHH